MPRFISRRDCLSLIGLLPLVVACAANAAETPIEITWADLIPDRLNADENTPFGIVEHGQLVTPIPEESAANVTSEYNGKTVRVPGFIVPLDYEEAGTREFLLVPYVGACIHVPPPPANQLIFVTADKPHKLKGMFDPVYVTGLFGTAATSTQLAEVGYEMSADRIEPYE